MPPSTADEIVKALRSDPKAYREAAHRESEVWSHMFSDDRIKDIREAEQIAGQTLRCGRHAMTLGRLAREQGLHFVRGLSLGCGSGRAERLLIKQGVCASFLGIDVAEDAILEAAAAAANDGVRASYRVADLNSVTLEPASYDLVVAQTSLHHVLELEFLADQVRQCLVPGGRLWITDFIGESQFQWLDGRLKLANDLLALLPEKYRLNQINGRLVSQITRRAPGTLISPFESIRSAEIIPIFSAQFEIVFGNERGAVLDLVCPLGTRSNFASSEDGRAIYELLMRIDQGIVTSGLLPPLAGDFLMRVADSECAASNSKDIHA